MPRSARIKDPTAIYHVMARSITEFDMFPDCSDKEYFLDLLQKFKDQHNCKIYCFCLMSNHYHIILDTCGFDISKFMKSLNQTYVKFINKKYKRKGHLLSERFLSKIIDSDEYMLSVSAYIHSNPKDLPEYNGKEFNYPYSSMLLYLGKKKDVRQLVDTDFILGCINENDKSRAIKKYFNMVNERKDIAINRKLKKYIDDFNMEQYEYKSYRKVLLRDKKPDEVIRIIAEKMGIEDINTLAHKWKRKTMEFRRVSAYVLNNYCGLGLNEITQRFLNISVSCCVDLYRKGYEAFKMKEELKDCLLGT